MRSYTNIRARIIRTACLLCLASTPMHAMAQKVPAPEKIPLWIGGPPEARNVEGVEQRKERGDSKAPNAWVQGVHQPTLTVYQPAEEKRHGTAVVICPGGGYGGLALDKEGIEVARWLRDRGVVAAVLKYRTAPHAQHPNPLNDAQRALRIVHSRADEWHIEPNRIGILGFSAGGHLAATAGTQDDAGDPAAKDPIDRSSCHADFMVLVYPVISMKKELTHSGSRKNLLGKNPTAELIELLSNERHVSAETGPTFLVHASNDKSVPVENSLLFYAALQKHQIPAELHIYENGGHGFGMLRGDRPVDQWPHLLEGWLRGRGLLK